MTKTNMSLFSRESSAILEGGTQSRNKSGTFPEF